MKGHDKIIQALNDVLTAELTAINQYFIHAKMCANWGYNKITVGETLKEQFELDLKLEYDAVARLNQSIALARDLGDNATRELLERILISEEQHIDWLETQLNLIQALGEPMYSAQQL